MTIGINCLVLLCDLQLNVPRSEREKLQKKPQFMRDRRTIDFQACKLLKQSKEKKNTQIGWKECRMLFEYVSIHNLKHAGLHNGIPIDNLPVQALLLVG